MAISVPKNPPTRTATGHPTDIVAGLDHKQYFHSADEHVAEFHDSVAQFAQNSPIQSVTVSGIACGGEEKTVTENDYFHLQETARGTNEGDGQLVGAEDVRRMGT